MPSGGGSNTTTTQSGPPPQVLANYQQVYGQAQNVAQQPYPTYNGSMLAGFTPQQTAGFNNINTAVNAAQPFLNQASQYTTNAASMLDPSNFGGTVAAYQNPGLSPYLSTALAASGNAQQYAQGAANSVNAQNFGQTVGNYYNPYAQSVIAPTQALFNEQNAEQLQQVRGNAGARGAFGGDREAIAEAETARQQQLAEAPTLAQLQSTGYAQAVQNALAAAGMGQQTAGLMQNTAQGIAGLGGLQQQGYNSATSAAEANAWLNSQAGFAMGNLGQEAQTLGLQGANAQIGAGGMQQQQGQQELNIPYQQFLAAQGYPYQITNWLEGMATGTGGMSGTMGSSTAPGPSTASQVAGLGLAGAGLVGSLNQAGAFDGASAGASALSGAEMSGLGLSSGADLSSFLVKHGGRIARAPGGGVPGMAPGVGSLPWDPPDPASSLASGDAAINVIPQPRAGSGPSMLAPTGSTTSGGGPSGASQAGQAIGDIAQIAGIVAMFLNQGGRVDADKLRALRSLRGIEIPRRAAGGTSPDPATMAMFQGNPMSANLFGEYEGMPTEKLQELAQRMPANQMVQRALQARHMNPVSDQPQQIPGLGGPPAQQQMQAAPGGYASGGDVGDDTDLPMGFDSLAPWMLPRHHPSPDIAITPESTSDWRDDAPPLGQTAGIGPSPVGGPYADFRMPPGGRPQDQVGQDYADSRMMPGGMPQDQMAPAASHVPIAGMSRPQIPMPQSVRQLPAHAATPNLPASDGQTPPMSDQQPGAAPGDAPAPAHHGDFMSGPWGTLTAIGLGIMGGTSPFPGVNIGRGAMQGLQFGENQQLRQEQQALRMQQAADLAQYRRDMSSTAAQRANTGSQRADTYQQTADSRSRYNDLMAQVRSGQLTRQQANDQWMHEFRTGQQGDLNQYRQGNQELRSDSLNFQRDKAVVGQAQRQLQLNQADQRIAYSQANAQAAQDIRRKALDQAANLAEKRAIQTATNSDIHAAASLAGTSGISYGKALQQIQSGRGSAEAGNGVAPGTTTGTAPGQDRPPLQSIFGQ